MIQPDELSRQRLKDVKRVLISLPAGLLRAIDRQAEADFSSRSDLIRRALVEYLHAPSRVPSPAAEELYTDPDELARVLRLRKLRLSVHKMLRERRR